MKITLGPDKDVVAALERVRRGRKASLRQVVNDALRRGLEQMASPLPPSREPFRTHPLSLGRCLVGNVDKISEVLATAEGRTIE